MNNNSTYEPRSPKSGSYVLDNSGQFKRQTRQNWSVQKNLPWQVKQARLEQEAKDKAAEIIESFRHKPAKSVFLVARRVKGGFRAIGFETVFPDFEGVKEFGRSIGRQRIRMGGVNGAL